MWDVVDVSDVMEPGGCEVNMVVRMFLQGCGPVTPLKCICMFDNVKLTYIYTACRRSATSTQRLRHLKACCPGIWHKNQLKKNKELEASKQSSQAHNRRLRCSRKAKQCMCNLMQALAEVNGVTCKSIDRKADQLQAGPWVSPVASRILDPLRLQGREYAWT